MEENEQCVICRQFNDQMLMLTCIHDPCINCAAAHFSKQAQGKPNYYFYTCQICFEKTPLDISSVIELEKLVPPRVISHRPQSTSKEKHRQNLSSYNNNINSSSVTVHNESSIASGSTKRPGLPITPYGNARITAAAAPSNSNTAGKAYSYNLGASSRNRPEDNREYLEEFVMPASPLQDQPISRNSYFAGSIPSSTPTVMPGRRNNIPLRTCKDHPEEEISYYCFKCLMSICPECAIHGAHTGHDVKNFKKATADVRKNFTTLAEKTANTQAVFKKGKQIKQKSIQELTEAHQKRKTLVSKQFDALRSVIASREKQVLLELDDLHQRNLQIVNSQIQSLLKLSEQSGALLRNIESILKKDEINLLDDYGKKNESLSTDLDRLSSASQTKVTEDSGLSNNPEIQVMSMSQFKEALMVASSEITSIHLETERYSASTDYGGTQSQSHSSGQPGKKGMFNYV